MIRHQKHLFESTVAAAEKRRIKERVGAEVSNDRIDKANGVIRDVKILGADSVNGENGRHYGSDARRKAVGLYEGAPVRIDHKPDQFERPLIDDIGVLRNIREEGDSVRGDFHFIRSHPLSEMVVEKAERFPDSFGFSHQADGLVEVDESGTERVVDLLSVESVDLVTRPATNKSLFEEEGRAMPKVKKSIRSIVMKSKVDSPGRKRMLEMVDNDAMSGEVEVEKTATPEEELDVALKGAINAILSDPELSLDAKLQRIAELTGSATPEEEEETPSANDLEEESKEELEEEAGVTEKPVAGDNPPSKEAMEESIKKLRKEFQESIKKEVAPLKAENAALKQRLAESDKRSKVLAMFESAGVSEPSDRQVARAMKLAGSDLGEYIDEVRQLTEATGFVSPRSSGSGGSEGDTVAFPKSREDFVRLARSGA